MRILPISKMKDKLNEYVDAVAQTQIKDYGIA